MAERQLAELNFASILSSAELFPSPIAWEDQVFYFLMLDRFSDDNENGYKDNEGNVVHNGETRMFNFTNPINNSSDWENAIKTEAEASRWRNAGSKFVGGNLKGLQSKIGYLKRLGVTALWVSPIFKQVRFQETYHGYGIQDFLEIEPYIEEHGIKRGFGTREDLRELVRVAHAHGIYVILDIILNHTGNVFSYKGDRNRP